MELGISSPLTQTGACKLLKGWLVDTASIYRIGIVRTGSTIIALSLGTIGVGGAMMGLNNNDPWAGLGIWTGLPMVFSGVFCISMRKKRPANLQISALSLVCLLGMLSAVVAMTTSIYSLWSVWDDPDRDYPNYTRTAAGDFVPLYAMNGLMLTLALLEVLFTVWATSLSVGYVWPCFRPAGSSIFTIMVEEPYDRSLDGDPDTEMSAFNGVQNNGANHRILEIQTEWIQDSPNDSAVSR